MKLALTVFIVSTATIRQKCDAFSPTIITTRSSSINTGLLDMVASKDEEKGIVESNVPVPVKTRKGIYTADVLKRPRRRRFETPPERESGYYESRVHKLYDEHHLSFDEYYLSENPTDLIVCLNNLGDTKSNEKSSDVFEYCRKKDFNFLCFDWFGRGKSSGKLMEATISRWTDDTIHFLENQAEHVTGGVAGVKAVLVGSGVGGWVAVLVALRRPHLVRGIVGLSVDPDFTEDLLWDLLPEEEKDAIMRDGFREVKWGNRQEVYPITSSLIEDGRKNLVLRGGKNSLEIMCPVRLIHSLGDDEVPYSVPLRLADAIQTNNIRLIMPKVGGHGLNEEYMPARTGWVDPEDPNPPVQSQKTIKTSLEECLDQVIFSTMATDSSQTW